MDPLWSRNGKELFYRGLDRRIMVASYSAKAETFIPEKPRVWSEIRLSDTGLHWAFDVAPDGKRIVGLFDAVVPGEKPETHLRVLLNVGDELRRREAGRK